MSSGVPAGVGLIVAAPVSAGFTRLTMVWEPLHATVCVADVVQLIGYWVVNPRPVDQGPAPLGFQVSTYQT